MNALRESQAISRIVTDTAPPAAGPYAQAVRHGNVLHVSGQLPINPLSLLVESPHDASAQARQVLANIASILNHAGGSLENVLKATIFLTRIEDFAEVNQVYKQVFGETFPARSCIAVSALPHPEALVEIEVTAALSSPVEVAL
ncbi:Rid family detoxifying hydrolase [Arthrobacter sp. D3-18]